MGFEVMAMMKRKETGCHDDIGKKLVSNCCLMEEVMKSRGEEDDNMVGHVYCLIKRAANVEISRAIDAESSAAPAAVVASGSAADVVAVPAAAVVCAAAVVAAS